jgi:UDP-glucose 4-epimerase
MPVTGKRILITGASGFIASHLVRACVAQGAEVTCTVRPGGTAPWRLLDTVSKVTIKEVDLKDGAAVAQMFADVQPDIVFNLAADRNRARKLELYEGGHETHTRTTLSLVRAALASSKPVRFVQTGTIEEYGRGPVPYREEQREEPITPYSLTKHEATRLVLYAAREHGLDAVVIRPSLTYGPLQGRGMLLTGFFQAALTTKTFDMSAGEQTRDFLFVEDAVRALILAGTADGIQGELFNIAGGVERKLKDAMEIVQKAWSDPVTVNKGVYPTDPNVETMRCFMDISKIHDRLGWAPEVTFEEGIRRTVEWYKTSASQYEHLWD